jgi:hypothetical protein
MPSQRNGSGPKIMLHVQVSGILAQWLIEMKDAGFVPNNTQAVSEGIKLLRKEYMQMNRPQSTHPEGTDE